MKQRYTLRNLSVLLGLLAVTGIAEAAAQTYDVKLTEVEIKTTRSFFKDTDYAALSVKTPGSQPQTAAKYLGDLSEGTHTFDLELPGIRVAKDSNDKIRFGWAITNSGHADDEGISNRLGQLLGSFIQVRQTPEGSTEISEDWSTGEGQPILVKFQKLAATLGLPFIFANCDGPVAVERIPLSGRELFSLTENATRTYTDSVPSPGIDSPKGCGKNSWYLTTIEITRTADQ